MQYKYPYDKLKSRYWADWEMDDPRYPTLHRGWDYADSRCINSKSVRTALGLK